HEASPASRRAAADFAFVSAATKSPPIRGRCSLLRPGFGLLCFVSCLFCEMLALQFALGDVIVRLGLPTGGEAELSGVAPRGQGVGSRNGLETPYPLNRAADRSLD